MYGLGDQNSALHDANDDTNRKESNDVWLAREELRVRSGHSAWVCVESSEKTEVRASQRVLDLGRYPRANSVPSGHRRKIATRRTKEEYHYGSPELVQWPGQRCQRTRGSKDGVHKVGCPPERCSSGMEETIQDC